jgi:hypothetical protein
MNFGSLKQFQEFKTIEKRFQIAAQCRAEIRPTSCIARPGSLPCAADRKAGWATAWRPGGALNGG